MDRLRTAVRANIMVTIDKRANDKYLVWVDVAWN